MRFADTKNLERTIRRLSEEIGPRLAGSSPEKKAAEYAIEEFRRYVPGVSVETFPVNERCVESESLEIEIGGRKQRFGCSLYGGAPTTGGNVLEGEPVFFDSHTDYQRCDLGFLAGKAVIHYGNAFPSAEAYRRMMQAKPAFLLMVDTRHISDKTLADGLFPSYVRRSGAIPTVSVSGLQAREWIKQKATRAFLCVSGTVKKSVSQNVIAELPGTAPDGKILYACGHLDTQAGVPGADDNAVGCAMSLELCRILSEVPHKRTIRFIHFGAEEQLSLGSCAYVSAHKEEIAWGGVCFNFDDCGTATGWTMLNLNATNPLYDKIRTTLNGHDVYFTENRIPSPTNDFFPFSAHGIGGFSMERYNNEISVDYHHRADDTIEKLSMEVVARQVDAVADLMRFLADEPDIGAYCGIDGKSASLVSARWRETFEEDAPHGDF